MLKIEKIKNIETKRKLRYFREKRSVVLSTSFFILSSTLFAFRSKFIVAKTRPKKPNAMLEVSRNWVKIAIM